MIIGIGTDIVHIPRMARLLEKHGDKIAKRLLAQQEWQQFQTIHNPAAFLAKRFAAKEAVVKALGTGFRDGMRLSDIAVISSSLGQPTLAFSGKVAQTVQQLQINHSYISLSDEAAYAIAYVIMEQ